MERGLYDMKKELEYVSPPIGRELEELREIARELKTSDASIFVGVLYGYSWGVIQGKRAERRRRLSSKIDRLPEREKQLITKLVGWLSMQTDSLMKFCHLKITVLEVYM